MLASTAYGQERSPLARIEALSPKMLKVGRVTTYYAAGDRERAERLATLSEQAAAFFERELGVSFEFRLAALAPDHWFSPYGGDLPYGIPWASVRERLIVVPASTTAGALVRGRDESFNRRMIEFVALHEFGHIANKHYYHPSSTHEEFPIPWFEELLATYFAYTFFRSLDGPWTDVARREWAASVKDYTPRLLSLDWSFMKSLPGSELARTYAWYQLALNLRVADVHAEHEVAFLKMLKENLPLDTIDMWTTASLLARLEKIAPGFKDWSATFHGVTKKPGSNRQSRLTKK